MESSSTTPVTDFFVTLADSEGLREIWRTSGGDAVDEYAQSTGQDMSSVRDLIVTAHDTGKFDPVLAAVVAEAGDAEVVPFMIFHIHP